MVNVKQVVVAVIWMLVILFIQASTNAATYTSTAPEVLILDNNSSGVNMFINIPDSFIITDVNCTVVINHQRVGDLEIVLYSPAGQPRMLSERRGGEGDNFRNTCFDDEAPVGIQSIGIGGAYRGRYRPEASYPLSVYDGQNAMGSWRLNVRDRLNGIIGNIVRFSLTFNGHTEIGTQNQSINGLGLGVPDEGSINISQNVSGLAGVVTDVDLCVQIDHAAPSQIAVELIAPDQTSALLWSSVGGSGSHFLGTAIDDQAPTPLSSGSPPFRGRWRTDAGNVLAAFNGCNPNGTWTLRIHDLQSGTVGVLNEWFLSLQVAATAPANDLCANAIPILCGTSTAGTTNGATVDVLSACGFASAPTAPGVWYSIVGTGTPIKLSTCHATGFDTQLSIFTGDCDVLICVTGNDNDSACAEVGRSLVSFDSSVGVLYRILVHGAGTSTGDFIMLATCVGDFCGDSASMLPLDKTIERSLFSTSVTSSGSCTATHVADMHFLVTAPCTGEMIISTCGTHDLPGEDLGIDTVLFVRTLCAPHGVELACNDNWPDAAGAVCANINIGDPADAAIRFNVTLGQTYYVTVASRHAPDMINRGRFQIRAEFLDTTSPWIVAGSLNPCYETLAAAESAALAATIAGDVCGSVVLSAATVGTCSAVITVTATDEAGNSSHVTYNTSIVSTPPTMISGMIHHCYNATSSAEAAAIAATIVIDPCNPSPMVKAWTDLNGCTATITVMAFSTCGGSNTVEYTTMVDATPPMMKAGAIASCWPSVAAAESAAIAATIANDTCGSVSLSAKTSMDGCSATITVTATDPCSNISSVAYSVTIDSKPPILFAGDISACFSDAAGAVAAALAATTAEDSCSTVALSAEISGEGCDQLVTVTGTDACGLVDIVTYAVRIDAQPPVLVCGADMEVAADAGRCDAVVSLSQPIVSDGCDGETEIVAWRSDEQPLDQPYPTGETLVFWQAVDECGLMSEIAEQRIVVRPVNVLMMQLEINGLAESAQRCIEFMVFRCDGTAMEVSQREVLLQHDRPVEVVLELPCGEYECIMARDPKHTLWKSARLKTSGTTYAASMAGGASLVSGNLNGDTYVDIIDFAVFIYQFGDVLGAHAPCGYTGFHADLDGDGIVYTGDYTHIQSAFLRFDDQPCCGGDNARNAAYLSERGGFEAVELSTQSSPTSGEVQVSVAQLAARGLGELAAADLNADGYVDVLDMALAGGGTQLIGRNVSIMRGGLWSANAKHHPQQREGESGGGRDVIIAGDVMLDLASAAAQRVIVMNGATLRMMPGTELQAQSLAVQRGGSLVIDAERATLLLRELLLEHGEQLHWQQGTIEISAGTLRVHRGDLAIGSGQGPATLRLMNGANAELPANLILASHTQASATLELIGTQTHMRVRESLIAGLAGNGRITINSGAAMHATTLRLGVGSAASGLVRLHDDVTQLRIEGRVAIGEHGAGRLELDERAALVAGPLELGAHGEMSAFESELREQE